MNLDCDTKNDGKWRDRRWVTLPIFAFVVTWQHKFSLYLKKEKRFSKLPKKRITAVSVGKPQIIQGKYFVNHSFSGFEN